MTKQLTTQNATITTAAVEMKTLTVTGKQVTLAVFRQLQEEPLIAYDGTLNGVPWGRVNYHPDKCSDNASHWHIVWQHGSELRRCMVMTQPRWPAYAPPEADQLLNSLILRWVSDPKATNEQCPLPVTGTGWGPSRLPQACRRTHAATGIQVDSQASPSALETVREALKAKQYRSTGGERMAASIESASFYQTSLAALRAEVDGYGQDFDELHADLDGLVVSEAHRRQSHRLVRAGLADLPQLFIAV